MVIFVFKQNGHQFTICNNRFYVRDFKTNSKFFSYKYKIERLLIKTYVYARLKINFQTFIESTRKDSDYCTIKKK